MGSVGGFSEGKNHAEGGIPLTVKSTGQKISIEGGEAIINKANMASDKKYKVEGTPKQIASLINEIDGNGVKFEDTSDAEIIKLKRGGLISNGKEYHCPFETLFHIKLF